MLRERESRTRERDRRPSLVVHDGAERRQQRRCRIEGVQAALGYRYPQRLLRLGRTTTLGCGCKSLAFVAGHGRVKEAEW
ncbi:hypothetical protein Hanom_Chr04g00326951 [Helianthus anomalus]